MNYQDFMEEDLRLALLLLLKEARGTANESVLHTGAVALGHAHASRSKIRAELDWLRERGLVTHEWFADKVLIAKITERGLDVAEGREDVAGVKRPAIGHGR